MQGRKTKERRGEGEGGGEEGVSVGMSCQGTGCPAQLSPCPSTPLDSRDCIKNTRASTLRGLVLFQTVPSSTRQINTTATGLPKVLTE